MQLQNIVIVFVRILRIVWIQEPQRKMMFLHERSQYPCTIAL